MADTIQKVLGSVSCQPAGRRLFGLLPAGWKETLSLLPAGYLDTDKEIALCVA